MNNFSAHKVYRRRPNRQRPSDNPLQSKLPKLILAVICLIIISKVYFGFFIKPGTDIQNSQTINIQQGSGLKQIAKQLKKENLINSKFLFVLNAKLTDQDTKIQSGYFRIPLPQNIKSLTRLLSEGPLTEDRITIPEGYKISQIDDMLAKRGLIQPGEFTECTKTCDIAYELFGYLPRQENRDLEGFLFPDTYFISTENFTPQELITKMLDNFASKLPTDWEEKAKKLPKQDIYTIVTMASIIEREVRLKDEMQTVSGILWKRYINDWPLGADATLLYLKDNNLITISDLEDDNPYNTRKFTGFPPTPISNPGTQSIEAALNPTESPYWFYLTTLDTGEVIYAETNEQHNANKRKYL